MSYIKVVKFYFSPNPFGEKKAMINSLYTDQDYDSEIDRYVIR